MNNEITFWSYVRPQQQQRIKRLQSRIGRYLPDTFERETDLHISIMPKSRAPITVVDDVLTDWDRTRDELDTEATITGLSFYPQPADPSTPDPHVVMLDVTIDGLDIVRQQLRSSLERHDEQAHGSVDTIHEPAPAHITLFRSDDEEYASSGITEDTIAALRTVLEAEQTQFNTPITPLITEQNEAVAYS